MDPSRPTSTSQEDTDRKRSEEELRESEEHFRLLFHNMLDGFAYCRMLFDDHGHPDDFIYLEVNESFARLTNLKDVAGKKVSEVIPGIKDSSPELLKTYGRVASTGRPERFETYFEPLGIWFSISVYSPRKDHFVAVFDNITDRKRAQETVSLLSQAVEATANSIVLTDHNGVILWVNPAFTRMTGYTLEEAVSHTPRILKSGRQPLEFYQNLWSTILKGDTWRGQLVNRRKDGTLYDEQSTITPIRGQGADITHFVSVREDITGRLETEESLRAARRSAERAKAQAEEANQAKDHFLAVLSHELRTPLTPVLAAVQLMQRKPDLSEDMHRSLDIVRRNVQLEARLIDDLLDLTRIAEGKLVLERKPINICTVIERAVEICKPDIDARKLRFELEMKGIPHRVDGDMARLQQVIWNLLNNAVKFTPAGGSVRIRCYREDPHVIVEVVDTGIGIEPAATSRIFNAFEQAGFTVTRQFGGLGLGLAIAKRLVEMHGGTIAAYSEGRDRGSTFRIALPLSSAELAAEAGKRTHAVPGLLKRILIVEDNGDTATTMKMLLEAFGYEIETACDVAQALKAIELRSFDLLISDLGLPDQSGIDLMQELRRRGDTLKGIAVSGYGHEQDVRRSKEAGFSVHLTKPVDADALLQTIDGMLRSGERPSP